MAVAVNLKKDNLTKKGFVGFSWTTFFFGCFVPLFRGDVKWAGIMLALGLLVSFSGGVILGDAAFLPILIYQVVFAFIYNKRYTENLLKEGYEPVGDSDRTALKFSGLYAE